MVEKLTRMKRNFDTWLQELVQGHCHMSADYFSDLSKWAVEDYYSKNVHIFELPHTKSMVSVSDSC